MVLLSHCSGLFAIFLQCERCRGTGLTKQVQYNPPFAQATNQIPFVITLANLLQTWKATCGRVPPNLYALPQRSRSRHHLVWEPPNDSEPGTLGFPG